MKEKRKQTESLAAVHTHTHTHTDNFREKGITLIALVVTIVVLLILAGVSINLVLGNNGIITKAKESRTETRMSQIDEQVKLAIGDAYTDGIGSITDSGLKSALNNHIGKGTYDITGDETTGWKVTVKETGKTYDITANGDSGSSGESGTTVDWDAVLGDAKKNPEKYKDEKQSETNGDIGIGTDGLPVNMDWWNARIINGNEIALGDGEDGCNATRGYVGNIIDGKIEGKIPEYVKKAESDEFYKVTSLDYTFVAYTDLVIAPEIPNGVTNMKGTFRYCTSLETAPEIPSGVTSMRDAFFYCKSLVTITKIPNGVTDMAWTFCGCESLEKIPEIPNGVTNMEATFYKCTSLEMAPKLPNGITSLESSFEKCTSLETAPEIPSSVISMKKTFKDCSSLVMAPKIPSSVTSMYLTFAYCTNLITASDIPSAVTDMDMTFYKCTNLTGTIVINAKTLKDTYGAFYGTVKPIVLKGTSTYLEKLAATATNGNVTVQTTSE